MRSASWFSLIRTILKNGTLSIPSYDYQKFQQSELGKLNSLILPDKPDGGHKKRILSPAKSLLPLPGIGPLIAFTSYYRAQKRWPTYIYHWPEKKLAYVRISKSACTSVQAALLQAQHADLDVNQLNVNQINYLGMRYIKQVLSPGYTCFTVVRDPVDRLISCYYDQCTQLEKGFYYFQDYLFGIIKPNLPIGRFLAIINEIPDFLKDIHFRPQSSFLKNLPDVKVFKLEEDQAALKTFLESYGLSLKHLNYNPRKKLKAGELGPASKKLLRIIYREDFKQFNYSVDF